jgi:hypothetical protein
MPVGYKGESGIYTGRQSLPHFLLILLQTLLLIIPALMQKKYLKNWKKDLKILLKQLPPSE